MLVAQTTLPKEGIIIKVPAELNCLCDHVYRMKAQYHALTEKQKKLPTGHVIVQMHFAENVACESVDKI